MSIAGHPHTTAVTQPTKTYRELVVGDTSSTTTGGEFVVTYRITAASALSVIPAPATTAPSPHGDLKYRESRVNYQDDGLSAIVDVIYRSDNLASTDKGAGANGGLAVGTVQKSLDVGVATQPIELHPYFATATSGAALTAAELFVVRTLLPSANSITDNGTTMVYSIVLNGTSTTGALTGKARQLADYKLHGVDSYYIPSPIFRLTEGHTSVTFGTFGEIARRDYPGNGLPGDASKWLKVSYRADDRGSVESSSEEWQYSRDGWDTLYNILYNPSF